MRFLVIVLLFCLALIGSVALAMYGLRGSVENELRAQSLAVLQSAGYAGVEVEFDHLAAKLSGHVDDPADVAKVVALLALEVPTADWPAPEEIELRIRPTLPSRLFVRRKGDSEEAVVEGTLGADGEAGRTLLGSRLRALPGIASVDNRVELDPKVLPFPKMAEFASIASGLFTHPGEVEVEFSGETLRLVGIVPNDGIKSGLLDLAAAFEGAKIVDGIEIRVPDNFTRFSELKLTRNRFGLALSGVLPSEETRESLLVAVRQVDAELAFFDRIEIGENCGPALWQEHLPQIVPAILGGLEGEMTAEFTTSQIRLHGRARDQAAKAAVIDSFAALLDGESGMELLPEIELGTAGAGLADAELIAVYEGGLLVLSGRLPGEGFGAAVKKAIETSLPEVSVKDDVAPIPDAAEEVWVAGLSVFFAEALGRVETAKFTLSKGEFELSGRTLSLPDRQILENLAVNTLPSSVKVRNGLMHKDQAFPKPDLLPEERSRLAEALKPHIVYFEKGSETIEGDAKAKVSAISSLVRAVEGDIALVVTGVSDNIGNPESNRALSLRRAAAVVEELKRLGLPETALSTDAKIENVSSLPRSERWKARRVEVAPKPPGEPGEN